MPVLVMEPQLTPLNYRSFVKKIYFYTLILLFISELIVIRLNIFEIIEGTLIEGLFKLLVVSGVIVSIYFRIWFFIRPRVNSQYFIKDDGVLICFKKNKKLLLLDQISEVQLTRLPPRLGGGFWVRLVTGQKFTFSTLLTGSDQIFKKIYDSKPELIPLVKYERYMSSVKWLPLSWARLQLKIQNWRIWGSQLILAPLLMSLVFKGTYENSHILTLLTVSFALCLILILFIGLLEHHIFIFLAEKKQLSTLNSSIERGLQWGAIGLFVVFFILISLGGKVIESYFH